jgi:hypothetical protein
MVFEALHPRGPCGTPQGTQRRLVLEPGRRCLLGSPPLAVFGATNPSWTSQERSTRITPDPSYGTRGSPGDPPLLLDRPAYQRGVPHLRGYAAVRRWWETLLCVYPDCTTEIEEIRDLGDVTIASQRFRGHGIESGVQMEQRHWYVARWRDNKCFWWRSLPTEAEAFAAAGRLEQDAHADSRAARSGSLSESPLCS